MEVTSYGPYDQTYEEIEEKLKSHFHGVPVYPGIPKGPQIKEFPVIYYEMTDIAGPISRSEGFVDLPVGLDIRIYLKHESPRRAHIAARNVATQISLIFDRHFFKWASKPCEPMGSVDLGMDTEIDNSYEAWESSFVVVLRIGDEFLKENPLDDWSLETGIND